MNYKATSNKFFCLILIAATPFQLLSMQAQMTLHTAAEKGDATFITQYASPDTINERKKQETPLLVAARCKQTVAAIALLNAGAQVTATGSNGKTAMHFAAETGNIALIKELLQRNVPLDQADCCQRSPIYFAIQARNVPAIRFFTTRLTTQQLNQPLRSDIQKSALFFAAANVHKDAVIVLLQKGADPNACSSPKKSNPLHAVITASIFDENGEEFSENERLMIVCKLLNAGARVDCVSESGFTPSQCAHQRGYHKIQELLDKYAQSKFIEPLS